MSTELDFTKKEFEIPEKITKKQFAEKVEDLVAYLDEVGLCLISENNYIVIEDLNWQAEPVFADGMESCMQFPESEEMDYIIKQL